MILISIVEALVVTLVVNIKSAMFLQMMKIYQIYPRLPVENIPGLVAEMIMIMLYQRVEYLVTAVWMLMMILEQSEHVEQQNIKVAI